MQDQQEKNSKKSLLLNIFIMLVPVAFVLAMVHPIYLTHKVTRRAKAETMAPLIDEIYRFYHDENQWPDEEQFHLLAQNLGIDTQEENIVISANPENLYMIGRLGGKRYLYYYFITPENSRGSDRRSGWWFCKDGTHYSYFYCVN